MLTSFNGQPDIESRLLEVNRSNGQFIILRSEYDYLGSGKIKAKIEEDEDGLYHFSFISNEEEARKFVCDDDENSEYIRGDILEDDEEVGEFILRKVSNVSLP